MGLKIPNSNITKSLKASRADIRRQLELLSPDRFQKTLRAALGPLEEMRRAAGRLDWAHQIKELERRQDLSSVIKGQFCLPQVAEAEKMLREYKGSIAMTLQRYQESTSNLKRAIESMQTPWLDMQNELRSLKGFAALQGIGHALRTMPPFGTRIADALRADLGDWRNETAWPPEIFIDPQARTSFYEEHGLNPALTTFSVDAFEQITITVNINFRADSVPMAEDYNFGLEIETDTNESDLYHSNSYALIRRLETLIRKYIDKKMEAVFGVDWVENQVGGEIQQQWLNKRQKALCDGEREQPLIAYAAFTDYAKIITQDDNWENAFKSTFRRKKNVQESFRRLVPIRNRVAHSRPAKPSDALYLYVETKRILTAIGIRVKSGI